MTYKSELTNAMTFLGEQPDTVFIGQQVRYKGNTIYDTLTGVRNEKRIEFPVAEDMQLGVSLGMSLAGKVVVSIFPRMDFLLCAMNQLVNHLDKVEQFTNREYMARVIIRTAIGSHTPLYPGVQHCSDYYDMFLKTLRMPVIRLTRPDEIMPYYRDAYYHYKCCMIIEECDLYDKE